MNKNKQRNANRSSHNSIDWTKIIVALITLSGVIFTAVYQVPSNKPNETQPLIVALFVSLAGNNSEEVLIVTATNNIVQLSDTATPLPLQVVTATPNISTPIVVVPTPTIAPVNTTSSIPTGLSQFPQWSTGVYASSWLVDNNLLTSVSAQVQEQSNQSYSFEIYIDSSRFNTHGYVDGGIFWDTDSATCKYVPLDTITTVTVHAGASVWGMTIDTTSKENCR